MSAPATPKLFDPSADESPNVKKRQRHFSLEVSIFNYHPEASLRT
jgi:hypothetical protein